MTTTAISSAEDIIDSRDVIARIAELDAERDDVMSDGEQSRIVEWHEDYGDELGALNALAQQGEDLAGWTYGVTLIRDSYFTEYAQELADDIGAIDANASWPLSYIDWDAAADALKMDYTSVEFDGVTYWGRQKATPAQSTRKPPDL